MVSATPPPGAADPAATAAADEVTPFDITGELPEGTTLLEASAGTGKTFTIAGLVTRYVAEGHATIDELLVITFTRAASQELRDRVRAQLLEAERALGDPTAAAGDNQVIGLLVRGSADERALRRERIADALAAFDTATIATTHQFCQQVLTSLGVAGDSDPGTALVEDIEEQRVEVVDDLYLARYGNVEQKPPFDRAVALTVAREAVADPQATIAGLDAAVPDPRARFAADVRHELDQRKRRLGILGYDDLLSRLAAALRAPESLARERMRRRWKFVLVDEFQDTDPVQWEVIREAFVGHATVVLIGDPKQAIYAFRGGDVATYLAASALATKRATLGTNWRADAPLVARTNVLLDGAQLGDSRIVVRPVAARHAQSRLLGPGGEPVEPMRLRAVAREGRPLVRGLIPMRAARDYIAGDVAADIAGLLTSGTTFEGRPVEARDVAVLVEVREHGQLVADRLGKLGIPAVVAGGGQVFQTRAAEELATVLRAIERPQRAPLVRAAALTSFFGATPLDLVNRSEEITDKVADTLRGWGLLLRTRGVAAVMEAADEAGLVARVLGEVGGERHLTDLRHLTELLHQVALRERTGLPGLIDWLEEERRADAGDKIRRLDSDAAAVQIVTIHGSKGLQYPVVYVPFVFSRWVKDVEIALFHDADGRRFLDVSGRGPDWSDHRNAHLAEESGESLRKLYVAITRAQSQVVTWWAPTMNTEMGPLHRMMFGRQPGWGEVLERAPVKEDPDALMVLRAWETAGGPVVEEAAHASVDPLPRSAPSTRLARRRFERSIDDDWRRTSYSGLLRVDPVTPGVVSEPEVEAVQDEPDPEADALPGEEGASGLPVALRGEEGSPSDAPPVVSPMTDLPAGAAFGSLVHGVLEVADPMAPDLLAALTAAAAEQLRWWPVEATADELASGLLPSQLTPLGPIAAGLSLSEIPLSDRLCELDFEFPLAGGEDAPASGFPTLRDLAGVLRAHLADDDILAAYPDHLERPPLGDQPLKGYLSGSIDVVLRVRGEAGEPRFVVVDYKTNVLGDAQDLGLPMRATDYGRAAMAAAMIHSHYPLQALLYAVVLHRFLRWRLPGYDPQVHLGGVAYLFLRGMCGAETPADGGHPTGVFAWQPGDDLVVALSDLLAGGLGGVRDE